MYAYPAMTRELTRYDRGVTGFLEYQALANQDLANALGPLLEPLGEGAKLFLANVLEMARNATASEILVRENERYIGLKKRALPAAFNSEAAQLNHYSVRAANRASDALRKIEFDSRLSRISDEKGMQSVFQDAREQFVSGLLEFNITNNADFFEVVEIWDESIKIFHDGGATALRDRIGRQLDEFSGRRMTDERGTSPASPLPWWKYVLIAVIIGAAIFAVIACFVWTACTWAIPAVAAAAPWVFGIIDRGC